MPRQARSTPKFYLDYNEISILVLYFSVLFRMDIPRRHNSLLVAVRVWLDQLKKHVE